METRRVGTAVAAPAVIGVGQTYYVAYAAGGGLGGAEPNRKINLYRGDRSRPTVLEDRSNDAVALTWGGTDSGRGRIHLAWASDDMTRRLHLASSINDEGDFGNRVTLDHTSLGGPSLAYHENSVVLAWTGGSGLRGGPADRHINVMLGTHAGTKPFVLPFISDYAPSVAYAPRALSEERPARLYIAWADPEGRIFTSYCHDDNLGELADPSHVEQLNDERTFTSPTVAFHGHRFYVAWVGTDHAHRVNIMAITNLVSAKVALAETASSAIAMVTYTEHGPMGEYYAYRGTDGVGGVYVSEPLPSQIR